jgi:hypothetical protein
VFSVLSKLPLHVTDTVPIGDALPTYHFNIPVNHYRYEDAVLHMKKEKGEETLDVLIENYKKKIIEVNEKTYHISQKINEIIGQKLTEFGYQINGSRDLINVIRNNVNIWLKRMHDPSDLRVLELDPTIPGVEDKASQCLRAIVKDEEVRGAMFIVQGQIVQIRFLIRNIREKASSISEAIQDEDYDRDASCCPTYLTILRRFF